MRKKLNRVLIITVLIFAMIISPFGFSYRVWAAKTVKLSKKKVVLYIGETQLLKVKNTKKKVKWSTSKKKVATVSKKGVVKARAKGTTKITAKVGKKKLVCQVKVKKIEIQNSSSNSSGSATIMNPTDTLSGDSVVARQQKVLALVNRERAKEGKEALVLDSALCQVAMLRAKEIVTRFSHTRPNGTSCFTVLKEAGISYMSTGENIAAGQSTPTTVMSSWMNSTGHRENILSSDFGKIGIGYVKAESGYGHYWVQIFTN